MAHSTSQAGSPRDPTAANRLFFRTLFPALPNSARIEVRLFRDAVKGEPPVGRHWFATAQDLLAAMPKVAKTARVKRAGVFFGVLPRKDTTSGQSRNTMPGRVVWADLDFKDYAKGEVEARARLAAFPIAPMSIVRTGHGLHAYWKLKEEEEPAQIVLINSGIRDVLRSDNVQDAARVLRVPGTFNVKDVDAPVLCEIESIDPEREANGSDFDELLPLRGEPPVSAAPTSGERPVSVLAKLPDAVVAIFARSPRIHGLFEGRGKLSVGEDGRTRDNSSSGYDASMLCALIAKGITDECTLATVLYHRPDGAAAAKGERYLRRTVRRAIAFSRKVEENKAKKAGKSADFVIDGVRIFACSPAAYEFTIAGSSFIVAADEIVNPKRFAIRFADALHRVPTLPTGDDWSAFINAALAEGERVELPPEAGHDGARREAIARILSDLQVGDDIRDLDGDKAFEHKGRRIFRLQTVARLLREDFGTVREHQIARLLRGLGYESKTFTIQGASIRAWVRMVPGEPT